MMAFIRFILLLFFSLLESCLSAKQQVTVHSLPNYDVKATHQILFMDFTISRSKAGKREQVSLVNSILGTGELKDVSIPAHTPYQIQLLRYYSDNQPPKETSFEHPLFRSIEIADANGTLSRTLTNDPNGHLSVRFAYTNALTKVELYRITPDEGRQKIYTLRINP